MGTKISALTETGSAPTGAYYPLEHDNANYKISTETLRANLGGKYVADWAQSHGGVTVANGATLTITHNLGTADVQVMAYANSSASNTNAQSAGMMVHKQPEGQMDAGCMVTSLDTNSLVLQLASKGFNGINTGGVLSTVNFANQWLKVVVLAAGSSPTNALYDTGWIDGTEASSPLSSQVSGAANFTLTHNAGRDNYVAQWQVADDAVGTNRVVIDYSDQGDSRRGGRMYELEADSLKFRTYPTYTTFSAGGEGTYNSMDNRYVRFILSAAANGGTNKYVADWATSHGGTTVDDEATLAISHDLGTTDFNVSYYVNDAATDTNAQIVTWDAYPSVSAGAQTTDVSTTGVTTQLGKNGYVHATSAGQTDFSGWAGKYLKAVFVG